METTVIIGAGASGLICGHELADHHANVIILEQSNKSGRKILASGNGRCNLSNTNLDMRFYNTNDKRIEKIIHDFDAKTYFDQIGVLTRQVGTLLYPRSNQSLTIKNALMNNFDQVALIEECQALKIIKKQKGYLVKSTKGNYECDNVVIATGSPASCLSGENNYDLVKDLDLKMIKLYPSLVQVKTKPAYMQLKGVRVKCKASLYLDNKLIESQSGEVLFTDQGLSGICIMQLSRLLPGNCNNAVISLDLLEDLDDEEDQEILKDIEGIGTEATRANILETLKNKQYLLTEKNKLTVSQQGITLCKAVELEPLLASAEMTAKWEKALKQIGQKQRTQDNFLEQIKKFITKIINDLPNKMNDSPILNSQIEEQITTQKEIETESEISNCPICKTGKILDKGKFYGCSNYNADEPCKFSLPKKWSEKTLSKTIVKELIEKGETKIIKGFKSKKTGKKFDAKLKLSDGKLSFNFDKGE